MGGQDGVYPRLNGTLIQSGQYNGQLVSVVGKLIAPDTLQTADSVNITIDTQSIEGGIVVNPDMCLEIIGTVQDVTTVLVSGLLCVVSVVPGGHCSGCVLPMYEFFLLLALISFMISFFFNLWWI